MPRLVGAPGAPLAASLIGHAVALTLLVLLIGRATPPLPVPAAKSIQILLPPPAVTVPPPPEPAPQPVAAPQPPPPPVVEKKPPPPPPVVQAEPPPPHPKSKPVVVRRAAPPREPPPPPVYYRPVPMAPPPQMPSQTAAIPRPPPPPTPAPAGPLVSAAYRAALAGWLESHKRYPESARERGESGSAVLRFHVERSGRVLDHAIVRGTGYPDLDAELDRMMQGAVLPRFPADMTASDIEVSVTVRFALAR